MLQHEAKLQLFREAVDAYTALTHQVSDKSTFLCHLILTDKHFSLNLFIGSVQVLNGHGIDNHLLGLKLQAIEEGLSVPKIFMDTAYGLATHWKLRTGQVCFCVYKCGFAGLFYGSNWQSCSTRGICLCFMTQWKYTRELSAGESAVFLLCDMWCSLNVAYLLPQNVI